MAKKDVNFWLDTRGGAYVLQVMTKEVVRNSATRIRDRAVSMSGGSSGHTAQLAVDSGVKGERFAASVVSLDAATTAQMAHGNYVAKAKDAGRV